MIEYHSRFQNSLQADPRTFRRSLIRQTSIQPEPTVRTTARNPLKYVIWPALIICGPVTVLATILLVIVFTNRVRPERNLLDLDQDQDDHRHDILVNFSASEASPFICSVKKLIGSS